MRLDTIPEARAELAKLIERKHDATMSDMDFRILAYGFQTLLTFLKAEKDLEIEARIEAIEAKLETRNNASK